MNLITVIKHQFKDWRKRRNAEWESLSYPNGSKRFEINGGKLFFYAQPEILKNIIPSGRIKLDLNTKTYTVNSTDFERLLKIHKEGTNGNSKSN